MYWPPEARTYEFSGGAHSVNHFRIIGAAVHWIRDSASGPGELETMTARAGQERLT